MGAWEFGSLGVWTLALSRAKGVPIPPLLSLAITFPAMRDSDLWFPTFRRLRVAFDFSFPALRQRPLVPFGRRFSIRDIDSWFYIARYWQMAHFVTSLLSVSPKGFKDAGFMGQR